MSNTLSLRRWLLPSLLLCTASCTTCDAPSPGDAGVDAGQDDLPLDVRLGDGEVRCGVITQESELIGGDGAYGQVGDYKCLNRDIQFIVQGSDNPVGIAAGGGTLIDVDLVRPEGEPGQDTFREWVVAVGANEVDVDHIEILDDGRSGGQAILRVEGTPAPLSVAPQVALLAQDVIGRVRTDYVLHADSTAIEIRTTFLNEGDDQVFNLLFADAIAIGAASPTLNTQSGFAYAEAFAEVPFASTGGTGDVSYAFTCSAGNDMTLPFDAIGVKVTICSDDSIIVQEGSDTRWLFVGDGDIASVAEQAWALHGTDLVTLSGSVSTSTGAAAGDASVVVLQGEGDARHAISQAFVDDDGRFSLAVPAGDYEVVAHMFRGARAPAVNVTATADTDVGALVLSEVGSVEVTTDFTSLDMQPLDALPAKLMLVPTDQAALVDEDLGEWSRSGSQHVSVSADGSFVVDGIPVGAYRLYVSRGFEFTRHEEDVVVTAGGTVQVDAHLHHVLDTGGLVATEFHQHSLGSLDADVPTSVRVLENAAEGVEFASSTEHDNVVDFRPFVEHWGIEHALTVVAGSEVSYQGIGHFNVYPYDLDNVDPKDVSGVDVWWQKNVVDLFADVRVMAGDPIVQINHPRDGTAALFAAMRLDPSNATRVVRDAPSLPTLPSDVYEAWPTDFEAIEVNREVGQPEQFHADYDATLSDNAVRAPEDIAVLHDYFALLGAGMHVAAMGNSDSHHPFGGIGSPRSFVAVDDDTSFPLSVDAVRDGIREQHVFVGDGCLLELLVDGGRRSGVGDALSVDDVANLQVRLQAPPYVGMEHVELYINGRAQPLVVQDGALVVDDGGDLRAAVDTLADNDVVQAAAALDLGAITDDTVLLVVARGDSGAQPTGSGDALCYSAPVYIDVDNNGWTGWHAATQTLLP